MFSATRETRVQSPCCPVSTSNDSAFRTAVATALAVGLLSSMTAVAAEPPDGEPPSWSLQLGAGGMTRQKPYIGIDRDYIPLPLIQFENEYINIFGPGIEVKLPGLNISDSQKLNFGIVAEFDGSGYKASDALILGGMSKRKYGIMTGAKVQWSTDLVDVSAQWDIDVSGHSKGHRLNLGLERTWMIGDSVMLSPRAGAMWQDKKYVDYYFGVRASEARIDRPAYAAKSGINPYAGLRGIYMINDRHSLFADVDVTFLSKEIKNSPLVNRSTENGVFLGYLYRFR